MPKKKQVIEEIEKQIDIEVDNKVDFALFNRIVGADYSQNSLWLNNMLKSQITRSVRYKKEDVMLMVENPTYYEKELREVAKYLQNTSSFFLRLIDYLSKVQTLDHMLIPVGIDEDDAKSKQFKKSLSNTCKWLDSFDIKKEFRAVLQDIVAEDVTFVYLRKSEESFTLQKLPSEYCKLIAKTDIGYKYAFNFMYFLNPMVNIEAFPPEFKKHYDAVKSGKRTDAYGNQVDKGNYYWVNLNDDDNAIAFKFNENSGVIAPPLMGVFGDALEIENYKSLIKSKLTLDVQKLVYQKIPMRTDKDAKSNAFLIDLDSAGKFHANVKAGLAPNISLVTTPMELGSVSFDKQAQTKDSLIGYGESNFWKSAGIIESIFSADNSNIGLTLGTIVDAELVSHCLMQFAKWINFHLKKAGGKIRFKIFFPGVTIFNKSDMLKDALQAGQFGYSKMLIACIQGFAPQDFLSLMYMENGLEIITQLIPLASAHTGGLDSSGRPLKDAKELSDKGLDTRNKDANNK